MVFSEMASCLQHFVSAWIHCLSTQVFIVIIPCVGSSQFALLVIAPFSCVKSSRFDQPTLVPAVVLPRSIPRVYQQLWLIRLAGTSWCRASVLNLFISCCGCTLLCLMVEDLLQCYFQSFELPCWNTLCVRAAHKSVRSTSTCSRCTKPKSLTCALGLLKLRTTSSVYPGSTDVLTGLVDGQALFFSASLAPCP